MQQKAIPPTAHWQHGGPAADKGKTDIAMVTRIAAIKLATPSVMRRFFSFIVLLLSKEW